MLQSTSDKSISRLSSSQLPRFLLKIRNVIFAAAVGFVLLVGLNHAVHVVKTSNATMHQGDYAIFAETTRALTQGRQLYVDYWDTKPPGLFFLLAPYVVVFGNTLLAIQLGTITFFLIFIASMSALAYELSRSKLSALLAGLLALLFTGHQLGPETTFVMMTLGVAATWLAVRGRGRTGWMIAAGAVFAIGMATKQPLVVAFPALLLFSIWKSPQHRLRAATGIMLGVALIACLGLIWAISQGIMDAMIYRVVEISSQYVFAKDGGWHFRSDALDLFKTYFLGQTWPRLAPFMILGATGLVVLLRQRYDRHFVGLALLWFALSFAAAAIPRGWRADYFTQVIPPLIAVVAVAAPFVLRYVPAVQIALVLLFLGLTYQGAQYQVLPQLNWLNQDGVEDQRILDLIATHSENADCLWTWGELAHYNYLSGRNSCASAALSGFMMDDTTFPIRETRIENMHEMLASDPALHITDNVWGYYPQLEQYADRYLDELIYENGSYTVYTVDRSMWHETDANFGNEIRFIGYDLLPVDTPICPGDTLTLAMTWQQISTPTHQYQMFVQLLTPDETAQIAGYNGPPEEYDNDNPTNTWVDSGEIRLGNYFDMTIPADTRPGTYRLVVGLYDVEAPEQRVPVLGTNGEHMGTYAFLQDTEIQDCD